MAPRNRYLNIVTRPNSKATAAYASRKVKPELGLVAAATGGAAVDLKYFGGRTLTNLTFANFYLDGNNWAASDRKSIDSRIAALMTDPWCNNVIDQYEVTTPTTTVSPSKMLTDPVGPKYYTTDVEAQVSTLFTAGTLKTFDLRNTIFNFLLPRGVVLVDGFRPGAARHDHETEAEHDRRHRGTVLVKDEAADSQHGLGGFHGSVHVGSTTLYYSVEVYSAIDNGVENGIAIWKDEPWKNIVATLYHEMIEARTDPDVADVNRTGNDKLLAWYGKDGEIGDAPITWFEQGHTTQQKVWFEPTLSDGTTAPIQSMWSDAVHGPEGPVKKAHKKAKRTK